LKLGIQSETNLKEGDVTSHKATSVYPIPGEDRDASSALDPRHCSPNFGEFESTRSNEPNSQTDEGDFAECSIDLPVILRPCIGFVVVFYRQLGSVVQTATKFSL